MKIDIKKLTFRKCTLNDIDLLSAEFMKEKYHKTPELFHSYLKDQESGVRDVWLVLNENNNYLGYMTVVWMSQYEHFKKAKIPEINDFNMLPTYQGLGIGSEFLNFIEHQVAQSHSKIGLGVGLTQDYGRAQRLYVKRGYLPDKQGVTYNYKKVRSGERYPVDDDLILWLTKSF